MAIFTLLAALAIVGIPAGAVYAWWEDRGLKKDVFALLEKQPLLGLVIAPLLIILPIGVLFAFGYVWISLNIYFGI